MKTNILAGILTVSLIVLTGLAIAELLTYIASIVL